MSIGYWCIRNPWNTCLALDEFGAGTLDGNPLDGPSFDACGPAAIENALAAYENRVPSYDNIGAYRKDMILNLQWTAGGALNNPRTNGCFIGNVAWKLPRLGLQVALFHDYQDALLTEADVRAALATHAASIFIVTNAAALAGNEANIHGHLVVVAGYGGDVTPGVTGKLYVLNSDIAGQHGVATGQWTPLAQFLSAEPHGFVAFGPPPPAPPVETPEDENLAAATLTLQQIQQLVDQKIADALAQLKEPAGG